jgi:hypothetical protein
MDEIKNIIKVSEGALSLFSNTKLNITSEFNEVEF